MFNLAFRQINLAARVGARPLALDAILQKLAQSVVPLKAGRVCLPEQGGDNALFNVARVNVDNLMQAQPWNIIQQKLDVAPMRFQAVFRQIASLVLRVKKGQERFLRIAEIRVRRARDVDAVLLVGVGLVASVDSLFHRVVRFAAAADLAQVQNELAIALRDLV